MQVLASRGRQAGLPATPQQASAIQQQRATNTAARLTGRDTLPSARSASWSRCRRYSAICRMAACTTGVAGHVAAARQCVGQRSSEFRLQCMYCSRAAQLPGNGVPLLCHLSEPASSQQHPPSHQPTAAGRLWRAAGRLPLLRLADLLLLLPPRLPQLRRLAGWDRLGRLCRGSIEMWVHHVATAAMLFCHTQKHKSMHTRAALSCQA